MSMSSTTISSTQQPPPKRVKYTFSDDIEVLVGGQKERFVVHRDILCARSPFFNSACSERWRKSGQSIKLPEDDPDVFNTYLLYAYRQPSASEDVEYIRYINTYILADKLGDLAAANDIMDDMIHHGEKTNTNPVGESSKIVFERTPDSSPLRRLMVDLYVNETTNDGLFEEVGTAPRALLEGMIKEIWRQRNSKPQEPIMRTLSVSTKRRAPCYYHQHNESHPESECPKGAGSGQGESGSAPESSAGQTQT